MIVRDIGLALSGGGSRAIAFHLGCLRALHDRDLLRRVQVVSGISGGALLSALWAYGPEDFPEFDEHAVGVLRRGLQSGLTRRVLAPPALIRSGAAFATSFALSGRWGETTGWTSRNRTDALADLLSAEIFGNRLMPDVTQAGLQVVLTATDLRTGGAVRFGSKVSAASRLGVITDSIPVADAVAASAAYPLLLPSLQRTYTFERHGARAPHKVLLSDGGVYDNLGLSVLEPNRNSTYTSHAYDVRYIVSCDAGRASTTRAPKFLLGRTARAFDIVHRRAQDHGRARLFEWSSAGHLDAFVMTYLPMHDNHLPVPIADLVPRDEVSAYPTNFAAMTDSDIDRISTRGEQLTRTLTRFYCPDLV